MSEHTERRNMSIESRPCPHPEAERGCRPTPTTAHKEHERHCVLLGGAWWFVDGLRASPASDEITITRGKRRDGGPLLFAHADVSDLRVQAGPEWPDAMLDAGITPGPALVGGSDPAALDALAARITKAADELRRAIRERWRCPECRDDRWEIHVEGDFGMRRCMGCQTVDRSEKHPRPSASKQPLEASDE